MSHHDSLTKKCPPPQMCIAEGLKWMLLAQLSADKCKQQELCQWILRDPPGHRRRLESRLSSAQQQEAAMLAKQWNAKQ